MRNLSGRRVPEKAAESGSLLANRAPAPIAPALAQIGRDIYCPIAAGLDVFECEFVVICNLFHNLGPSPRCGIGFVE